MEKIRTETGFSIDDIESITISTKKVGDLSAGADLFKPGQLPDPFELLTSLATFGQREVVVVARLSKSVDLTKNQAFQSMTEAVTYHGGVTYYRENVVPGAPGSGVVYFPTPRVIVICGREDVLLDLIDHGGKADPRPEMHIIDPSQHFVLATVVTRDLIGAISAKSSKLANDVDKLAQIQAFCVGITATDGLEISVRQWCADSKSADELRAAIEQIITLGLDEYRKLMPLLSKNAGLVGETLLSSAKSTQKERIVETVFNLPATSRENLKAMPDELFAMLTGGAGEGEEDKPERTRPSASGFDPITEKEQFRGPPVIVENLEGLPKGLLLRGRAGWMPDEISKQEGTQPLPRLMTFDIEYGGEVAGRIVEIGNLQVKKIEVDPPQFLKLTANPESVADPGPFNSFVDKRDKGDFFDKSDCVQIRLYLDHPNIAPVRFTTVEGQVTLKVATETKTILVPDLLEQVGKPVTNPDLKAAGFEIVAKDREDYDSGSFRWYVYFSRTAKVDDLRVVRADGKRTALAPLVLSWDQFEKPGYAIGSNQKPPAGLAGKVVLHTQFEELTVPFRFENVPVIECPDMPYVKGTSWGISTARGSPEGAVVAAQLRWEGGFNAKGEGRPLVPKLAIDVTGPAFRYVLGVANKKIDTAVTNSGEVLELRPAYQSEGFEYTGHDYQTRHFPPDGATIVFDFKSVPIAFESLETVTGSCRVLVAEEEKRTVIEKLASHFGKSVANPDLEAAGLELQIDQTEEGDEKELVCSVTKGNGYAFQTTNLIPAVTSENTPLNGVHSINSKKSTISLKYYTIKPDDSMEVIYYTGLKEIEIPFAFSKLAAPPPKEKTD